MSSKSLKLNKNHKKGKKKLIILIGVIILILLLLTLGFIMYRDKQEKIKLEEKLKEEKYLQTVKDNYNTYMVVNKEATLYNKKYEEAGKVSKGVELTLDASEDYYKDGYYKLKNYDLYLKYDTLDKSEEKVYDTRYKNYIEFNKNIVTDNNTKLYIDENTYYIINDNLELPVIIDEDDKYYVSFDDKLVYVLKDEATVKESDSVKEIATEIAVLNYHFVINLEAGEGPLCEPSSICHTDSQFDSHVKYMTENNFYTITMKELEMFIDGKINLPKKSVAITIDDGWFVARSKAILEKYNAMGTLFLIGSLAPVSDYLSPNLEVHSHTWNLHFVSNCSEGRSPLLCYDKNKIVEDLKQSRESLNNTPYFCYPFYDYNNNAIEALKEAGFTMALAGGNQKVKKGVDKYKVPRYVVYNTTTVKEIENMIN